MNIQPLVKAPVMTLDNIQHMNAIRLNNIPEQNVPFPVYPSLHEQLKLPRELEQVELM